MDNSKGTGLSTLEIQKNCTEKNFQPHLPDRTLRRQTKKRSVSCLVDLETDLNKIGSYLLSHLKGSTIGVDGLNFSVRDGKRWNTVALAT